MRYVGDEIFYLILVVGVIGVAIVFQLGNIAEAPGANRPIDTKTALDLIKKGNNGVRRN